MSKAMFETSDGEDIEVESEEVARLSAGDEPGTTVIELQDGEEVVVIGTPLEAAAELGLSPLDYVLPDDEDEADDDLDDDEDEAE